MLEAIQDLNASKKAVKDMPKDFKRDFVMEWRRIYRGSRGQIIHRKDLTAATMECFEQSLIMAKEMEKETKISKRQLVTAIPADPMKGIGLLNTANAAKHAGVVLGYMMAAIEYGITDKKFDVKEGDRVIEICHDIKRAMLVSGKSVNMEFISRRIEAIEKRIEHIDTKLADLFNDVIQTLKD